MLCASAADAFSDHGQQRVGKLRERPPFVETQGWQAHAVGTGRNGPRLAAPSGPVTGTEKIAGYRGAARAAGINAALWPSCRGTENHP